MMWCLASPDLVAQGRNLAPVCAQRKLNFSIEDLLIADCRRMNDICVGT
jgi:hypothetical protein